MDYLFTDLILLMGTNPLPNYVAASYFIKRCSNLNRIWMICSEKNSDIGQDSTEKYADNLKRVINKENKPIEFGEIKLISDINSDSEVKKIANQITEELEKNKTKNAHFFYTGGTKFEVVHTYITFLNIKKGITFSFSYLSARDFKIYFDDSNGNTHDLRKEINIDFTSLIKLHGFDIKEQTSSTKFPKVVGKFQEIIENGKISEYYDRNEGFNGKFFKQGCQVNHLRSAIENLINPNSDLNKALKDEKEYKAILNAFKPNENNRKKNFEEGYNYVKKLFDYKPTGVLRDIFDSIPEDYQVYKNGNFNKEIGKIKYRVAIYYMDGFWFEDYVSSIIEEKNKFGCNQLLKNIIPDKRSKFEIDIALMKGYQLIGISCTTSNMKSECKQKGFEIILRTRQIGGTEAKAILITRADKSTVELLQYELKLSTGTLQKNIMVLGIDDWKPDNMEKRLESFIKEN